MKKFIFILLITIILPNYIFSAESYGSAFVSKIISIYDGDTFKVNIDGYPAIVGEKMAVRVNGIDTPEIKGKCLKEKELALKAKQLVVSLFENAQSIELRNMQRGKYFRIVADVYVDGQSLSEYLILNHVAVLYDGGTKIKNWCE